MSEPVDPCACTCGKARCASRRRRRVRAITHGTSTGYDEGCRCKLCTEASTKKTLRQRSRRNSVSRAEATRLGQEWTGPELEIATRPDLTAYEAATMIGRTMQAVKNVRHKCKVDPIYIEKLGATRRNPTA